MKQFLETTQNNITLGKYDDFEPFLINRIAEIQQNQPINYMNSLNLKGFVNIFYNL